VLSASTSKSDMSEDVDVVDDSGGSPVDVTTPTVGTVGSGRSTTTTYRYSKKKTPIVHLEKLNVVTDSNGMRICVYYILMETIILYLIYFFWDITLTNFALTFPTQIETIKMLSYAESVVNTF
jgi:hypothetical protein